MSQEQFQATDGEGQPGAQAGAHAGAQPLPLAPPIQPRGAVIPPTVQGAVGHRECQWPMTIGILGVVFSCLGILMGAWSALTPLVTYFLRGVMTSVTPAGPTASNPMTGQLDAMSEHGWMVVVDGVLGIGVWVWAIYVFNALRAKRPGSAGRVVVWSWIKILVTVVGVTLGAIFQWYATQASFAGMGTGPGGPAMPFSSQQFALWMVIGTVVFSILAYCAWPVFLLIWMRRKSIREQAAGWTQTPTQSAPQSALAGS